MFKFNSNRSKNDCYFPEMRWKKGTTSLTFQFVIKLAIGIVLSKWLPNSHSISRQGTEETKQLFILTLQCCFLFSSIQNVLKFTEQEHPDYYLLLVCVQRLRVFISHYTLLFQCNEDLLIQKRKKLKK